MLHGPTPSAGFQCGWPVSEGVADRTTGLLGLGSRRMLGGVEIATAADGRLEPAQANRLWLTYGAAAVVAGLLAAAIVLTSARDQNQAVVLALLLPVAWAFSFAGIVAWIRQPQNRTGPLLVFAGLTWLLGALGQADSSSLFTVGVLFYAVPYAVLCHLLLAYPTGRLQTRTERLLAAAAYLDATLLRLPWFLVSAWPSDACPTCPPNALLVADEPTLATRLAPVWGVPALVVVLGIVVVLGRRWQRASTPARRVLAPVFGSGVVALLALALYTFVDLVWPAGHYAALSLVVVSLVSVPISFLIGLLRVRLATADASRALLESNPRTHQEAQAALRRALDDPSLELVYWMPEPPGYVNEAGKSVDLPTDSRAWTAIEYDGRPAAAILHDPWLTQEPERIAAVVSAARLTVERDRLQAEVRAKMDELRSSRARIVEAGDTERRRLERNLHDGAQQRLVSLSLSLGIMERQLESPDQAAAVAGLRSELTDALNELRELARGLHPAILSDHGLAPALEGLAARASVPVELDVDIDGRLPPPIEAATYYVISEALTNIQKYAQATSARVALALDDDEVMLEVTDDGVGGADATQGSGLQGLADRIEALAGSLSIDSPKGGGTSLRAKIPHGLRD